MEARKEVSGWPEEEQEPLSWEESQEGQVPVTVEEARLTRWSEVRDSPPGPVSGV